MEVAERSRLASAGEVVAEATSGNSRVGLVTVAGRGSRFLVVMPRTMRPDDVELVRGCSTGTAESSAVGRPVGSLGDTGTTGATVHFTAAVDESSGGPTGSSPVQAPRPRLHVLGDDPRRSIFTGDPGGTLRLLEDFWPATFDLCRAHQLASANNDGSQFAGRVRTGRHDLAVPPVAGRAVWSALTVGSDIRPGDVVVVVIAESPATSIPEHDEDFWADPVPSPDPIGHRSRASRVVGFLVSVPLAVIIVLLGIVTALALSPSLLGATARRTPPVSTVNAAGPSTAGPAEEPAPGPTLTGFPAYAAAVRVPTIAVYQGPSTDSGAAGSFASVGDYGATQTFLIDQEQRGADGVWYEVLLPVRPNGTTGWVRADDVDVAGLPYRIKVHLDSLRLDLFRDGTLERTFPIGVGTIDTPTPPGTYSVRYLMRPDDQSTLYGHFVFGLSGYSDVVRNSLGDGELGIHGTNDPDGSIGRRVSHGCIRLRNEDLESLVPMLQLGTPVDVDDAASVAPTVGVPG